jgi:GNAT superfamily N-acetyltransferase
MISTLESGYRAQLAPLYTHHRHLRVVIDAILQGYCGTATTNAGGKPEVARLGVGVFAFFGGDPAHPAAETLIRPLSGERIIVCADGSWREAIQRAHGARIETEPRVSFSSAELRLVHLRKLMSNTPDGFRVERLNLDLARRIRAEVHPDLLLAEVFASPSDFVERGIGFCALTGGQLVCVATSAFVCDGAIEIQINTRKAYRGLGLATAVGAALLVYCLEHGIDPHWDAGDPASERVAEKLGYVTDSTYEWLVLPNWRSQAQCEALFPVQRHPK